MGKRWIPLESNPDVLNEFAQKLGMDVSMFKFQDVFSLDEVRGECLRNAFVATRAHMGIPVPGGRGPKTNAQWLAKGLFCGVHLAHAAVLLLQYCAPQNAQLQRL